MDLLLGQRRDVRLLGVLAAALLFAPASIAGNALPTIYATYAVNCTFTLTDDNGNAVNTIAPGDYTIEVSTPGNFADEVPQAKTDMSYCKGNAQFRITGPGVSIFTTVGEGGEDHAVLAATFQASSTYTAFDGNPPTVARATFVTAASGTPLSPTRPASTVPTSTSKSSATSILPTRSGTLPFRGTLTATVGASGALALSQGGKAVTRITAGRYTLQVLDHSTKTGFSLQRSTKKATTLTSAAFTGRYARIVSLLAGQWLFFYGKSFPHYFFVTA